MDSDFTNELNRRIAILTSPDFDDASAKQLESIDYWGIGLLIVFSLLLLIWGWY